MSQLKNFVSGSGRLNRRQFVVMGIATGFLVAIVFIILSAVLISSLWIEKATTPSIIFDLVYIIFVWFPLALAYFIRRGHDFGVKTFISACLVVLFLVLRIMPGIWVLLWERGIFLEAFNLIIVLLYIFYPGNKMANQYWEVPVDLGKPSRIFQYMRTGSWEKKSK